MACVICIFIEHGVTRVPPNGILLEDLLIYLYMAYPKYIRERNYTKDSYVVA